MVNPTQRSPRVPPVNKATWSFESILPRERKSLKAPEQGSQGPQAPQGLVHLVSKEPSETSQSLQDLDGAAQKELRTEQSTALSAASASLEQLRVENEGDAHVAVTGAAATPRKSEPIGPDRSGLQMQRDEPGGPDEPGVSPSAARGANQEPDATIEAARPLQMKLS